MEKFIQKANKSTFAAASDARIDLIKLFKNIPFINHLWSVNKIT